MSEITFSEGTPAMVIDELHPSLSELGDRLSIRGALAETEVVLARYEGAVVGYLAAATDPMSGTTVWEHVVAPEFRGSGVGRRLLLEIARRTPPMVQLTIDPTGDFSIDEVSGYYSRLGFPSVSEDGFQVAAPAHKVVDAIGEQLEDHTTVKAIVRRSPTGVITIEPHARIADALALLNDNGIGSVVVSSDGESIDGVLSERDIVVGLHSIGSSLLDSPVGDHMTTSVVTVDASDIIANVMELVTMQRLRHVPVTEDDKLIGIVSVGDLLVFRMREHDMRREHLPLRHN